MRLPPRWRLKCSDCGHEVLVSSVRVVFPCGECGGEMEKVEAPELLYKMPYRPPGGISDVELS